MTIADPISMIMATAALVTTIAAIGAAFYYIGKLSGRVDHLEGTGRDARAAQIRCQAERSEIESRLFDSLNELKTNVEVIRERMTRNDI